MKEILSVNHDKVIHPHRTNNFTNLLSKNIGNIGEIVNIINNNTTDKARKKIFGFHKKISAIDLKNFIEQPNSAIHTKKLQDLINIINDTKLSSKIRSVFGYKPITILGFIKIIGGHTKYQNDLKTKSTPITNTTISHQYMALAPKNAVSLNEIGEKK